MDLLFPLGTIMTISKDRVKPSPQPDSWKLKEIFATGIVLGGYLALMTVVFFWVMKDTDFFPVRNVLFIFKLIILETVASNIFVHSYCLFLFRKSLV